MDKSAAATKLIGVNSPNMRAVLSRRKVMQNLYSGRVIYSQRWFECLT